MGPGTAPNSPAGLVVAVVADDDRCLEVVDAVSSELRALGVGFVVTDTDQAERAAASARRTGAPVAFLGVGSAADATVSAAASGPAAALALLNSPLSMTSLSLLMDWYDLPLLGIVDPADRVTVRTCTGAYLSSRNPRSELVAETSSSQIARKLSGWLRDRLSEVPRVDEVSLSTSDGWEIHGTRFIPAADSPVPGVVLLHSGRSDRAVFTTLERCLARRGMAVLNIDWRGRGRSIGRGSYLELDDEDTANRRLDAAAALDHLANVPNVDADRLATLGVVQGAEIAARAALYDPRVKAVVLLTGYRPDDEVEAAHLTSGAGDVLYVASTGHGHYTESMRELSSRSSGRHTRYLEYPGALLGYQLFEIDPTLEDSIAAWLQEALTRDRP